MKLEEAPDVKQELESLVARLNFSYVDAARIICFRSRGSKGGAIARIWSLPRIWQKALRVRAHYVVEVCSEKYDNLSHEEKLKVLIHEMLHIPKNFSGSTVVHNAMHFDGHGGHVRRKIDRKAVEKIFAQLELQIPEKV